MTTSHQRYPQRVRNELRFRELTVLRVERISAGFQRIVLGGDELAGFSSQGFDDHTKVFFPQPGQKVVPPTVTEDGIVWPDGPRGSLVVPEDYAWQLYVCDESGMPALRRRLEAISKTPARPEVTAIVTIGDEAYKDYLAHLDGFNIEWIIGHNEDVLAQRLAQVRVPAQDYYLWITGEGKVVKNVSQPFEGGGIDPQLMRAAAYWHAK